MASGQARVLKHNVSIKRDWLTPEFVAGLGVSERQGKALAHVRAHRRIANADYQRIAGVARKTAARDLEALVELGVLERVGTKRGSHYVLARRK